MEDGVVKLKTSDVVLMGVAGSGKTTSLSRALDEKPPEERVSTPCAKTPVRTVVRTVAQTRIGVEEEKLNRIESSEYFDTFTYTVVKVGRSLPKRDRTTSPHSPTIRTGKSTAPNYMRKLEEEMIRNVSDETRDHNLLYDMRWSRLTDSGGQPQFLEMLPIFLHHISLGIFTIKLNERLDHHPMIDYYGEDGKPIGDPYESRFSHEHILRYSMRALVSQGTGQAFKFLFLGTHRDLIEESKGESLEDKNLRLRKIIRSFKMNEHVIYSNADNDPIFAIDAKNPGDKDWEMIKLVRKVIVESSDVPSLEIPIRWFAMELALLRYVKETKKAVLSEDECFQMVERYSKQDDFKAALKYLHRAKLIFYFAKGRLVVADMQMILDKLSEVVRYNIELVTNPTKRAALSNMWRKFCRHGILHVKCLDKFPDRYIEGVFSPRDLLGLFSHLCIVSELRSDEFLVPCLLEVEACCKPEPETQAVPALAVEFPNGGPMLGSFCRLICYLINTEKWELAEDGCGEPRHLSRNSIQFNPPRRLPGGVTISDPLLSFFVVTFHDAPKAAASTVCPLVREALLKGIEAVSKSLNILSEDEATDASSDAVSNTPTVTFLCTCGSTPIHPAILSDTGEFLSCKHSKKWYQEVTADHKKWFGGEAM